MVDEKSVELAKTTDELNTVQGHIHGLKEACGKHEADITERPMGDIIMTRNNL